MLVTQLHIFVRDIQKQKVNGIMGTKIDGLLPCQHLSQELSTVC